MKRIEKLFQSTKEPLSFTEIKEALAWKKDDKKLHSLLDHYLQEGILFATPQNKLAYSGHYICGTLFLRHNKTAFVIDKKDGQHYEVIYSQYSEALAKDEVVVDPRTLKILRVLRHNTYFLTGVIVQNKRGKFTFVSDIVLPETYHVLNWASFSTRPGQLVSGFISSYERHEIYLQENLGSVHSLQAAEKAILYRHHLPQEFPAAVQQEARHIPDLVSQEEKKGRVDLTQEWIVTIDGDDSRDFDDAISVKKEKNGYCLGVHIADVSHYVKEDSALDKEAKERGTSVYYPGHVVAMLPERLSNDLCSLNPGKQRLCLSVELHYSAQGVLHSYEVYPSFIISKQRLTYAQVNAFFAGTLFLEKESEKLLRYGRRLAKKLQERAKKKGTISFTTKECLFQVVDNKVVDVKLRQRGEAESLIETFMIAANCAVATLLKKQNVPALYRNHDLPKADKMQNFLNEVAKLGYLFPREGELSAKDLTDCLSYFIDQDVYPLINECLLQAMAKAKYSEECLGHFALGEEYYCHFTSPIRRYPDLFVHRMLHQYWQKNMEDKKHEEAKEVARLANEREDRAVQIERDMNDLLQVWYMADHVGESFDAVISGLTSFGIFAQLQNGIEGMIPLRTLDSYYVLAEDGSLSDGSISYRFGDKIKVRVRAVNRANRTIDFGILKARKKRRIPRWALKKSR